jgi:hypothetical protein
MPVGIQSSLEALKSSEFDVLWAGKPNAWVRELSSSRLSVLAERLVLRLIGGERPEGSENGFKVIHGEKYIEIKIATVGEMNGLPAIAWHTIRPDNPFTHLCFIAIYPDNARMFVVPKNEILQDALGVVKGSPGTFQLITRRVTQLYPWMVRNEVGAAL